MSNLTYRIGDFKVDENNKPFVEIEYDSENRHGFKKVRVGDKLFNTEYKVYDIDDGRSSYPYKVPFIIIGIENDCDRPTEALTYGDTFRIGDCIYFRGSIHPDAER